MKNVRTLRKRRAVSPVIATVIIVAVTITVAVAVSYWMSGIASQYTSFEKVEIQTAICTYIPAVAAEPDVWEIVVQMKNSGTKAATLSNIFVNDVETGYATGPPATAGLITAITAAFGPDTAYSLGPLHIESGANGIVTVWIEEGNSLISLTAGTTINIKIHSASGMDYIRLVQLT